MEDDDIRPDLGIFFHSGLFDKVGYTSQNYLASRTYLSRCSPPADPDLHIRGGGGGGGHPDPETDKGGQSSKKKHKKDRSFETKESTWQDRAKTGCFIVEVGD